MIIIGITGRVGVGKSTAATIIGFRMHCRLRGRQRAIASHEGDRKSLRSMSYTRLSEAKE